MAVKMIVDDADHAETVREVLRNPAASKRVVDARLRAFDRLPFLTDELRRSFIQLTPHDPRPDPIDPTLIRKQKPENCLLSAPFRMGDVVYFNLFQSTSEIDIDHQSDHLVGLVILEAVRQTGMALSHILGELHPDTRMALQEFSLYFYNYIEPDFPLVARGVMTLAYDKDLNHDHVAFIDVRQNGVTCLAGTSSGRMFQHEDRYQRIRGKSRSMNVRYAEAFAAAARGDAC